MINQSENHPTENNPIADSKAIIFEKNVRFTILTPQLIRMEWTKDGKFINNSTLVFINRKLPVPKFKKKSNGNWLTITTEKLILKYKINSGKFTEKNLSIEFILNDKLVVWHPGQEDTGNLKGTIRTLDEVKGKAPLDPGLLSRNGWTLIDDSNRPLFDNSDWQWGKPGPKKNYLDWYFFGYGHDYKHALYDFTRVAGKIPLPPRFAFGVWWSRYWAYTDQEFKQLVHEFEMFDVPLDVLVIDMDWHETFNLRWWKKDRDQAGQIIGWSGYTLDKILFPDPEEFLSWCKKKGLKTTLNLHPASGVQPHEEKYPEMARAMGIDPATQKYVPFDIVNKKFAENYLKILHHPFEKMGVDFWWLDWQQKNTTKIPGANPTWWLNYVHFTDMERSGKRPMIFHRWGGLGNHRYQIGFSGDTVSVWESLAFQPYFTATASNVCYGYWSHDIGGHLYGEISPELYTRWIQFGVFSPILRTHTSRNPDAERRIWAYPVDYFLIMRQAFLLRYALIPYIYTAARQAYDTGVSICRPMYYDYPDQEEAYQFKDQYMFGENILVAPITEAVNPKSMLAKKSIWLPQGNWIEWYTGTTLKDSAKIERKFAIDEIPIYVKAGAIIPMQPKMRHTEEKPVDPLILTIFPGDNGETRIYEDHGNSLDYKTGEYCWTPVRHIKLENGIKKIEILPVEGNFPKMLKERSYEIRLPLIFPPESVTCNGKMILYSREEDTVGWKYDGDRLQTIITLPKFKTSKKVEVLVKVPDSLQRKTDILNGVVGKIARFKRAMPLLNSLWKKEWSPDILIEAAQTGNRIRLQPGNALQELEKLKKDLPEILKQITVLKKVNREVVEMALMHLKE